jgi:hypothetical protein
MSAEGVAQPPRGQPQPPLRGLPLRGPPPPPPPKNLGAGGSEKLAKSMKNAALNYIVPRTSTFPEFSNAQGKLTRAALLRDHPPPHPPSSQSLVKSFLS